MSTHLIELACRRLADHERSKIRDGVLIGPDAVDLAVIKICDLLARELRTLSDEDASGHGNALRRELEAMR